MKTTYLLLPVAILSGLLLSACNNDNKKSKVNTVPFGTEANLTTQADTPLKGNVVGIDEDGDKLTYTIATQPTQGSITFNNDGTFVYTPKADSTGTDKFTFTVSDGTAVSLAANANITINPLDVAFDSYSRKAYAQDANAQPLPLNTRNINQNVTDPKAYDDLLK